MTLGWRTAFTGDIGEPFLQSGTMHMFAIDGLRIALVAGMIVILLRVLADWRAWCGVMAIPAIWFYTAATGWEASAMRASVMMTIVIGGWMLKRPGDLLNSVAAAAFIILVADPRQLFEASFQLSFCVMLVIALVLPPVNAFFGRVLGALAGPGSACCRRSWFPAGGKSWSGYARLSRASCDLSFAAWLGSLPLAAEVFSSVQPRLHAGQRAGRAAGSRRAHGQPGRADLRPLAAVGHGTFQSCGLVSDGGHDLGERGVRPAARSVLVTCRNRRWPP